MELRQLVGQHLRTLRELTGIGAYEAAKRANITPSNLYRLEKGKYSPSIETLDALCEGYGVDLARFFKSMPNGNGKRKRIA